MNLIELRNILKITPRVRLILISLVSGLLGSTAFGSTICQLKSKPFAEVTQSFNLFGNLQLTYRECHAVDSKYNLKSASFKIGTWMARTSNGNDAVFKLTKGTPYKLKTIGTPNESFSISKTSESTWVITDGSGVEKYVIEKSYETGDQNSILKFKIIDASSKKKFAILKKDPLTHTPDLINLMAGLFNWSVHISQINAIPDFIIFAMVAIETDLAN